MQFPDILKKYRANKSLTQKEVAEQLGIPAITVARMEQGINVRLDSKTIELLENMMGDRSLDKIAGISDIRTWLRCAEGLGERKNLQLEVAGRLKKQFWNDDIPKKILSDFANIGFERIDGKYERNYRLNRPMNTAEAARKRNDPSEFDVVLENKTTGKIWAIDFLWTFRPPFDSVKYAECVQSIYKGIGKSCCNGRYIQKYSLITNLLAMTEYMESNPIVPQNLQYDASVIHYDWSKHQMDIEKNLTFFSNGQGVFDINVEGESEAATLDYAKWTLMLNKQI